MPAQQGFSLLELLLSMLLSFSVISLLLTQMIGIKRDAEIIFVQTQATVESYWLIELLRSRVHAAGFTPCRRIDQLTAIDARFNPQPLLPLEVPSSLASDVFIRRMANHYALMRQRANRRLIWVESEHVANNRPIIVADCVHAEVHGIAHLSPARRGTIVELTEPLVFNYPGSAFAGEWVTDRFFLQKTRDNGMALYYQHHRVDRLSFWINRFAVATRAQDGQMGLHIELAVDDSLLWAVDLRVRSR